jgi:hypothetical protein
VLGFSTTSLSLSITEVPVSFSLEKLMDLLKNHLTYIVLPKTLTKKEFSIVN